jgi:hypothetical protein
VYHGKRKRDTEREMAGGSENGGHDQRAMEEGRKEEHPAADQGCAMASVPFAQKVR